MSEGHIDYDGWRRHMLSSPRLTIQHPEGDLLTYDPYTPTTINREPHHMTNWIYIETRMIDGYVSFAHVFVTAATEEEAYDKGGLALMNATHDDGNGEFLGAFLNDTVIELENN